MSLDHISRNSPSGFSEPNVLWKQTTRSSMLLAQFLGRLGISSVQALQMLEHCGSSAVFQRNLMWELFLPVASQNDPKFMHTSYTYTSTSPSTYKFVFHCISRNFYDMFSLCAPMMLLITKQFKQTCTKCWPMAPVYCILRVALLKKKRSQPQ